MTASSQGAAVVALRPPQPPLASGNGSDAGVAVEAGNPKTDVERFRHRVDEYISKANELEQKVNEVVEYYANRKQPNNSKGNSGGKDKEKKKPGNSGSNNSGNKLIDGSRKEAVCTKRMQELMRQFGTILKQITQHKWARPFMNPVDVKGLGLDDYYEVIKKPMDFGTIKNQMEAKDGNGYKNVREIYADVRLVFTNAMTYNDDRSDIHVMAKTLLDKFEEKWLQLLPKVVEEEAKQKDDEAQALANMQIAREAAFGKMARDTNSELDELNARLEELRKLVIQKCRKMSAEEKRKLGVGLSALSPEDLNKALEIIAEDNPSFQTTGEVVDVDMDAQSEITLWKVKFFVKGALELQAKNCASKADDNLKRKKEICDALAKTARKRNKKLSSL
ncbi:transcription factor GTE1-like isoform X1 [Musa acuminata AAA Group]|uniref:transcription factor GTE1-like isoform X1 n=1 Tax=Musa acuminata AAA Group TaxID=214697 RepID=UPI0031E472C3